MREVLEGIRYDGWELVIDVTGGGVAELMPRGLGADVVADRLRHLARALELNVAKRSPTIAARETKPDLGFGIPFLMGMVKERMQVGESQEDAIAKVAEHNELRSEALEALRSALNRGDSR